MPIVEILKYTIVFVEVESGGKGLELACLQLMTSLLCIAHFTGKGCLYGVVITKNFDQARLIKFDRQGCFADGIFHPSQLGKVTDMILRRQIS